MKHKWLLFALLTFAAATAAAQQDSPPCPSLVGRGVDSLSNPLFSGSLCKEILLPSLQGRGRGESPGESSPPSGIVHDSLYRFSASYEASSLGNGVFSLSDGVVSTIVEGDDGFLWLKDPFARFACGSWIKGRVEGDTVTFEFPQFIYSEQSGGFTLDCYVSRMVLSDDATTFVLDPERQDMKFLWKGGRLTQVEEEPVMGMSTWVPELGNRWFWVGYADYAVSIGPLPGKAVVLPEGAKPETYMLSFWPDDDTEDYRMTQVAISGQDIYMNNLSNTNPEAWVHGSYDGTEARFPSDDYLGISYRMNGYDPDQHIFAKTAREVKTYAESGAYQSDYYPTRFIDFTRGAGSAALSSDSVLAANAGTRRIYAEAIYRRPSLQKFTETAGTPQDPQWVSAVPYDAQMGYGFMTVSMPKLTTDGQRMNLEKLFYRIYLDDDLMTFYPDEYWYVAEPTIDMPYSHVDKRDFNIDVDLHRIFFYQSGFDRIGVQLVYRGGGEEHRSSIVYYDMETGSSTVSPGDGTASQWGTRKAETYDVAVRLDGAMYAGKTVERIRIPLADAAPVESVEAFLTTRLSLDGEVNKPDVASIATAPVGPQAGEDYGWAEVVLPEPYTITGEGLYVGYTLTIGDASTAAGKRPIVTRGEQAAGGLYVHTSRTYRRWQDIGTELGLTLAMEVTLGGLTENAATIDDLGEVSTQTGVTTPATLTLRNHGSNAISSIDLSYSVAGLAGSLHQDFDTPLPARYNAPTAVSLTLPAVAESGVYPLQVSVDKVNGQANTDAAPVATGQLLVYGLLPKHRPLVEEYTGTWCSNCPRGMVAMEEMARRHADDFIGVSFHNGDGMEITTTFPNAITAYPDAMIDRAIECDPYFGENNSNRFGLESVWQRQSEVAAPAAISVSAEWADEAMTTVHATAEVTFPLSTQNIPYRVAYMLVADGLTGTGRNWAQANGFQNTTGWELEGMKLFTSGAAYVQGLKFNDVVIGHSPWTGVAGSLPEKAEGNTPVQHSYDFQAASIKSLSGDELVQDKQQLRVVAMLVNTETGTVCNACKASVQSPTGIAALPDAAQQMIRAYYAPDGKRIAKPRQGLNIVRYADGTTEKVIY